MKFRTLAVTALVLFITLVPHVYAASLWTGAKCGSDTPISSTGGPTGPCSLCDLFIVGTNVINFLVEAAVLIATGMIVWGAVKLILARGSPDAITGARDVMKEAVFGLMIALAAWVIVDAALGFIAKGVGGATGSGWQWNVITCK